MLVYPEESSVCSVSAAYTSDSEQRNGIDVEGSGRGLFRHWPLQLSASGDVSLTSPTE
jgi:hypothetical protein